MENNEFVTNLFNVLNQPFVIAIGVALIIGIFALLIVNELSLGKKSVKEQNKKINNQEKAYKDFATEIDNKKNDIENKANDFIKNAKDDFGNFYNENEDFRNLVINCLCKINNKGVKELLEEYKNGREETKDN